MQTAGELDFETIFNGGDLLYSPSAYLLFIAFVVIMPILFSNLLVSEPCKPIGVASNSLLNGIVANRPGFLGLVPEVSRSRQNTNNVPEFCHALF